MEIVVGKTSGFCYGVKNAVDKTREQLENMQENVYCLGELIHNENVINELENKGLVIISDINEAKENSKVIIRAHGISKDVYEKAEKRHVKLIDLTCPKVLSIHKMAEKLKQENKYIILVGKKLHPEIIGSISFCGEKSIVIENKDEIEDVVKSVKKDRIQNIAVLCQTTFSVSKFQEMIDILKEKCEDSNINLEVYNTICSATNLRQNETKELAKQVEYMIIVGGSKSSNTQKLYEVAKTENENVILINDKNQLPLDTIKKYNNIGIMAGASTPDNVIQEIITELQKDLTFC